MILGSRQRLVARNSGPFFLALIALLLALCSFAGAQQNFPRIGYLGAGSGNATARGSELVRRELSKLGYVEGKNIESEYRNADNRPERLPTLAEQLVRLKVELIYAG